MTPKQIQQINSINPDILKLGEELKFKIEEVRHKIGCNPHEDKELIESGEDDESWFDGSIDLVRRELSGILSQCKSELQYLEAHISYCYCKNVNHTCDYHERISALKESISYMEGVLK